MTLLKENAAFLLFSTLGLYFEKPILLMDTKTYIILITSWTGGKLLKSYFYKQNEAGGTTPYNPLKIPAKKIAPIK